MEDLKVLQRVTAELREGRRSFWTGAPFTDDQFVVADVDRFVFHQIMEGLGSLHRNRNGPGVPVVVRHQECPLGGQPGLGVQALLPQSRHSFVHGHPPILTSNPGPLNSCAMCSTRDVSEPSFSISRLRAANGFGKRTRRYLAAPVGWKGSRWIRPMPRDRNSLIICFTFSSPPLISGITGYLTITCRPAWVRALRLARMDSLPRPVLARCFSISSRTTATVIQRPPSSRAPAAHTSTHVPQARQASVVLMTPSSCAIAPCGHAFRHSPQSTQRFSKNIKSGLALRPSGL